MNPVFYRQGMSYFTVCFGESEVALPGELQEIMLSIEWLWTLCPDGAICFFFFVSV